MKTFTAKNRTEHIISIVLLSALVFAAAAILVRQSYYDTGAFGFITPGAGAGGSGVDLEGITPAGFQAMLNGESYDGETLFEKINGKAPLYLEAGFRSLNTRRFAKIGDERLWMEVFAYDMGDARNSFSVFSQQRREDARDLPALGYAYISSGSLFFAKGRFYVEIIGSAGSDLLEAGIIEAGTRVAASVPDGPRDRITELDLFDRNLTVPGSEKFYVKSAFGYGKFTNLYTARYRAGTQTVTVFAGKREGQADAEAIANGYRKFLLGNGGSVKKSDASTHMAIVDLYGTSEAIAACGDYVVGVHEAESAAQAEELLKNLLLRFGEQAR